MTTTSFRCDEPWATNFPSDESHGDAVVLFWNVGDELPIVRSDIPHAYAGPGRDRDPLSGGIRHDPADVVRRVDNDRFRFVPWLAVGGEGNLMPRVTGPGNDKSALDRTAAGIVLDARVVEEQQPGCFQLLPFAFRLAPQAAFFFFLFPQLFGGHFLKF